MATEMVPKMASVRSGQQTSDQQPASTNFGEGSDVGESDWEGQVQRPNEGISEILDIGELL